MLLNMFSGFGKASSQSKCYVSRVTWPKYVDSKQLPSTKKPFATILNQPFTHTVDLLLPEELFDLIWKDVEARIAQVQYFRVIMTLSNLLEGDFFNKYIKTVSFNSDLIAGNILMLSEGRPGVDNLYSLKDGNLRLELSKENYERCGLEGKPISDGGRTHIKSRYAIEINLRLPSMVHGKKGFERIIWAFKNVLNNAVTWLFYDFQGAPQGANSQSSGSFISVHHPISKLCVPRIIRSEGVILPDFTTAFGTTATADFEAWAIESHEWISLVTLGSPRVLKDDIIDPWLCRHIFSEDDRTTVAGVVTVQWSGLIPDNWICHLLAELSGQLLKSRTACLQPWFVLSGHAFHTKVIDGQDGYTILRAPGEAMREKGATVSTGTRRQEHDFVLWEFSKTSDGRS